MKHCPNETCPFRKKHGHPAEYRADVQLCTDCGAKLAEGEVPELAAPEERETPSHLLRRLFITVSMIAISWGAGRILLPTVTDQLHDEALLIGAFENVSIVALGIMPLISASLMVELAALFVPRWRPLRVGIVGRAKLWRATLLLTLLLALFQAYGVSAFLLALDPYPDSLAAFHAINTFSLVAGTFFLLGLASVIDRWGLGHGIAILMTAGILPVAIDVVKHTMRSVQEGALTPFQLIGSATGVAIVIMATIRATRHPTPKQTSALRPHRIPASGLIPYTTATSILMLPLTFSAWGLEVPWLTEQLSSSGMVSMVLTTMLAVGLVVPFTWAFNTPTRTAKVLQAADSSVAEGDALTRARELLRSAMVRSALYVGVVVLASALASTALPLTIGLGALSLALLTTVVLDLLAEWQLRREYEVLVPIWEEHRVYAADAALAALEKASIPAVVRAIHFRTILQFFGPYVPMHVLVPEAHEDDARKALEFLSRDTIPISSES